MNEKAEVRCGERGILVTEEQLKKIKGSSGMKVAMFSAMT